MGRFANVTKLAGPLLLTAACVGGNSGMAEDKKWGGPVSDEAVCLLLDKAGVISQRMITDEADCKKQAAAAKLDHAFIRDEPLAKFPVGAKLSEIQAKKDPAKK